ncbi:MAG: TetR/AcrR family transcriptional regulator [Candidatus Latescibacterota bacterium]|nr:MAG: TetR/AcrR family transcriptional regulator [Candidatus Latescibacterota bacterium]
MGRIIGAVRELLAGRNFDEISINDIVKQARTSVGAFYARFTDKESLLEYLGGMVVEEVALAETILASQREWREKPLEKIVEEEVGRLVSVHRNHRGVLRAVVLRSMRPGPSVGLANALAAAGPLAAVVEAVKERRGEINHSNPEIALALGFGMVVSSLRERILFPELIGSSAVDVPITDAALVAELTRSLTDFLGVNTSGAGG